MLFSELSAAPAPTWDSEADDKLACIAAYPETHDVKTFVFAASKTRQFSYTPGQFLTFSFEIGGETINRCYTIASSPLRPHTISITVKRVVGGPVSNWLHDHLMPGMSVRAIGPMGEFTLNARSQAKYLFLSGGSGITPLMSMSRMLTDFGRPVDVIFVHAARTPRDIIFRTELDLMASRLAGFRVVHIPECADGEAGWPGVTGRISGELIRLLVPDIASREVFCCGPAPFMDASRRIVAELGVSPESYHQESFDFGADAAEEPAQAPPPAAAQSYGVSFTKTNRTIEVPADQFVLSAAKQAGMRLPAACTTGLCGTCKSKLISGKVDMKHQGGIRQREIDAGFFLPCCSKPLSELVVER